MFGLRRRMFLRLRACVYWCLNQWVSNVLVGIPCAPPFPLELILSRSLSFTGARVGALFLARALALLPLSSPSPPTLPSPRGCQQFLLLLLFQHSFNAAFGVLTGSFAPF